MMNVNTEWLILNEDHVYNIGTEPSYNLLVALSHQNVGQLVQLGS